MKKINTLNQIDASAEGNLLIAAIAMLTTSTHRDKTPEEVLSILYDVSEYIHNNKSDGIPHLMNSAAQSVQKQITHATTDEIIDSCDVKFEATSHPAIRPIPKELRVEDDDDLRMNSNKFNHDRDNRLI